MNHSVNGVAQPSEEYAASSIQTRLLDIATLLGAAVLGGTIVPHSASPWTAFRQAPLSMGILQARILEWVVMSSSRESSQPRDQTQAFHIAGKFFTDIATRVAPEY